MRNVIVGCAWQYQPDELAPFILSWKQHCPEVTMIIIIEPDATEEKITWLLEQGVEIKFFTSGYFIQTNIANSRYFSYLDILLEEQLNFDRVFLTDTRDVIFQGNIFDQIPDDGIHIFLEDSKYTCSESFNHGIISACYGETIATLFHRKPIICCGTMLGDTRSMLQYLISMTSARSLDQVIAEGMEPGWDQACHIYLFHTYRLMHTKHENGDGVATLCLTNPSDIELDGDLVVTYGMRPTVVHQWDRHENLVELFSKKYSIR
jgi:hypothetical protein